MDRQKLYEAIREQIAAENRVRRDQLLNSEELSDEMLEAYALSRSSDELGLQFVKFIIQMDEKLDKILEKLG